MSDRIWPYPLAGVFWSSYVTRAAALATAAEPPRVLDVGAGRNTPYAAAMPSASVQLIGIDMLADDLASNPDLTQRIRRDVVADGFPPEVTDLGLVTSRMVLEHISNLEDFARGVHDALAPGGKTIHFFAGRYSVFAILNRALPDRVGQAILYRLRPEAATVAGFPTHYHRTHARAAAATFRNAGLVRVETSVSYETSQYFHFCFPLFVLIRIWETALHHLNHSNLGTYVILTAQRPHAVEETGT